MVALTGPRNNFLKFVLCFYALSVLLNFYRWNDRKEFGNVLFGAAVYSFIAVWIGILQEGGMRYSTQQAYLGVVAGIVADSSHVFAGLREGSVRKKGMAALLFCGLALTFLWGAKIHWGGAGPW